MAKEIERKFLVDREKLPILKDGKKITQGYIPRANKSVVRIRTYGDEAFLTLKGEKIGLTRSEFEYAIPYEDATKMLNELCCKPLIQKRRYLQSVSGHIWEIDVFEGNNSGLIVAEIELGSESELFELPEWTTKEVTYDERYRNSNLTKCE